MPAWVIAEYYKNHREYYHHTKMVKQFIKCYRCRKNTNGEFHFGYNVNLFEDGVATVGNAGAYIKPNDNTAKHPQNIGNTAYVLAVKHIAEYKPIGKHLNYGVSKIPKNTQLTVTHIGKQFILCNRVNSEKILKIFF